MSPEKVSDEKTQVPRSLTALDYEQIAQILIIGKFTSLDKWQRQLLQTARGYLSSVNQAIQWVDFGERQNKKVGANLSAYSGLRKEVIEVLYPMLFPEKPVPSNRIPDDTKVDFQKTVVLFVSTVIKIREGTILLPDEQGAIPLMITFFNNLSRRTLSSSGKPMPGMG